MRLLGKQRKVIPCGKANHLKLLLAMHYVQGLPSNGACGAEDDEALQRVDASHIT